MIAAAAKLCTRCEEQVAMQLAVAAFRDCWQHVIEQRNGDGVRSPYTGVTAEQVVDAMTVDFRERVRLLGDVVRMAKEQPELLCESCGEPRKAGWRSFTTRMGEHVEHRRFEEFVATAPLRGVGGNMDLVRRIASADPVLADLLDRAVQRDRGRPTDINDNITVFHSGTGRDQALRRLRKDRPDLHAEVLAGDKSAHAAMVEAGFRKRTLTVPAEPGAIVRLIRRHFDADQVAMIREGLA